jgi:N6-adenosine-specific RNA methylase IME4
MSKKYEIIYADPAWLYKCGKNHLAKKSMINGKDDIQYDSMTIEDMKNLRVGEIANDNCLLFMWITSPFLKIGIDLLDDWGFKFSTVAFVWYKERTNPGSYTMSECELCIVAKKGKIPSPRGARNVRQFLSEARGKHSAKPIEIQKRIELMFPTQNKLEMFTRQNVDGWDAWGNEIDNSITIE